MGAINKADEGYKAVVAGCEESGGDDYLGYKIKLSLSDTGEVFEKDFTFSDEIRIRKTAEGDLVYDCGLEFGGIVESCLTGKDASEVFCDVVGLDPAYIRNGLLYRHTHPIDADKLLGTVLGVIIGDYYGERTIKGFCPVYKLSTMAVVD